MSTVESVRQLAPACRIERLPPFGLKITAGTLKDVREIGGSVLEQLLRIESLVLLRGFRPLERDELLRFCLSYPKANLLEWDFGPVMEMQERPDAKNYLFTRERVPFHWDGAFHRVPSYLVFSCVAAPREGGGGETLFTDTTLLWRRADVRERARWSKVKVTYETEKLAHYGGKVTVPMAGRHPYLRKPILRYAEPVESKKNPVRLAIEGIPTAAHLPLLKDMERRIYSPDYCYAHRWQEGDLLLADNHALLHGRNAYTADSPRHLRRVQLL